MITEQMQEIFNNIEAFEKIAIFRHFRPDGDAVGSTKGLCEILRLTYPEKDIRLLNCDYSDYISFLGEEDKDAEDSFLRRGFGHCDRYRYTLSYLQSKISALQKADQDRPPH